MVQIFLSPLTQTETPPTGKGLLMPLGPSLVITYVKNIILNAVFTILNSAGLGEKGNPEVRIQVCPL